MKKLLTGFLVACALVVVYGHNLLPSSGIQANTKPQLTTTTSTAEAAGVTAQIAPDFTFTDLVTGKTTKLSDLRDKPVYLNFWATWCPPCVKELPHIQAKYEQYKDRIHFLAISVDSEQEAPAQFISSKGYTFTVGYGNEREISRAYNIEAIPASYIIGTDGTIKAQIVGSMDEADLESFLQKAL